METWYLSSIAQDLVRHTTRLTSSLTSVPLGAMFILARSPSSASTPTARLASATTNRTEGVPDSSSRSETILAIAVPVLIALPLAIVILAASRVRTRMRHAAEQDEERWPLFHPHSQNSDREPQTQPRTRVRFSDASFMVAARDLEAIPEDTSRPDDTNTSTPTPPTNSRTSACCFFDNPFADGAEMTSRSRTSRAVSSVSPSTYPLRDRLTNDSVRRARAIRSLDRETGRVVRRTSVGERELAILANAFEEETKPRAAKLCRRRSLEETFRGGEI